jgi:hypothetical protein
MKRNKIHGFLQARKKLIRIMKCCLFFIVAGTVACFASESYPQEIFFTIEYDNCTSQDMIHEAEPFS